MSKLAKFSSAYSYYGITGPKTSSATALPAHRAPPPLICYQWFKQRLILTISKRSVSQRSQIKKDTVEPSVPAREFNLKAYAAIT